MNQWDFIDNHYESTHTLNNIKDVLKDIIECKDVRLLICQFAETTIKDKLPFIDELHSWFVIPKRHRLQYGDLVYYRSQKFLFHFHKVYMRTKEITIDRYWRYLHYNPYCDLCQTAHHE